MGASPGSTLLQDGATGLCHERSMTFHERSMNLPRYVPCTDGVAGLCQVLRAAARDDWPRGMEPSMILHQRSVLRLHEPSMNLPWPARNQRPRAGQPRTGVRTERHPHPHPHPPPKPHPHPHPQLPSPTPSPRHQVGNIDPSDGQIFEPLLRPVASAVPIPYELHALRRYGSHTELQLFFFVSGCVTTSGTTADRVQRGCVALVASVFLTLTPTLTRPHPHPHPTLTLTRYSAAA